MVIKLTDENKANIRESALHLVKYSTATGDYFISECWINAVVNELNRLGCNIELEQEIDRSEYTNNDDHN